MLGLKKLKFIEYSFLLFPFLWVFTLLFCLIEAFTYSGFVSKHLFLPLDFFLFLTFWLGLFLKLSNIKSNSLLPKILLILIAPMFLLFLFLAIFFPLIEALHFSNYVYSNYHLHPSGLFWPWFLVAFLFFINSFSLPVFAAKHIYPKDIIKKSFVLGLFVFLIADNLFSLSRDRMRGFLYILRHPLASYDDKMKVSTGELFYNYVLFIKGNTLESSKILIPPQGYPWPQTGNKAYLQYFLYPRHLLNGQEKEAGVDLKKEKIDYVLLAWGESSELQYGFTNGWPKFDVKAKQIIYMIDEQNKKIVPGDYHYDPEQKNLWGLIELNNQ